MNALPFRTTARISALLASGASLHVREDAIEVLTRSITENSAALLQRIERMDEAFRTLQADVDRIGGQRIPAASRNAAVGEVTGRDRQTRSQNNDRRTFDDQGGQPDEVRETRMALGDYVRRDDSSGLEEISVRAGGMSESSDPDGGYLVLPQISSVIRQRMFDQSPLVRLARYVEIETGDSFEEPVDPSDIGAEWVEEHDARPATDTTKLVYMKVPLNEIYANQPVTQRLLDDSSYNVGAYIETKISDKFARTGGAAFVSGDGIGKPQGLLYRATSPLPDGERDYFTMQHLNTGVAGGFPAPGAAANPADPLIDLVYSLRAPYRPNARWLMNLKTAGVVRKMKDAEGRNIWSDGLAAGQPALLLGFPVELDEEMPDIGVDSLSIAFGDFQQGYIVIGRTGVRLLTDPYTSKPNVLFYAYTRIGGQVQNGEAVKLLRFSVAE